MRAGMYIRLKLPRWAGGVSRLMVGLSSTHEVLGWIPAGHKTRYHGVYGEAEAGGSEVLSLPRVTAMEHKVMKAVSPGVQFCFKSSASH